MAGAVDVAFEVCNRTWRRITSRYADSRGAAELDELERTVVLVWTVTGIVGNGGFEYLFGGDLPGDPDYHLSLEAFERIGCQDAARSLRDAIAVFPDGKVPEDGKRRRAMYMARPEDERDRLAVAFFEAEAHVTTRLAEYIREHNLRKG